MVDDQLITKLFHQELEKLAVQNGLTPAEVERIQAVFQQALKNDFMTEHQIYPMLIEQESAA